jgi:hypothetical protein
MLAMLLGQTALFFLYSWRTVDDLELEYLGWFAMSIPAAAIWFGGSLVLLELRDRAGYAWYAAATVVSVVGLVALVSTKDQLGAAYRDTSEVTELADSVAGPATALEFEHGSWPAAVAVLAARTRAGQDVCVIDASWEFMMTSEHICESSRRYRIVHITGPGEEPPSDEGTLLYSGAGQYATLLEPQTPP